MKIGEKHIESLILNRSFEDLTSSEKSEIKELADNATTFNELKLLLQKVEIEKTSDVEITPRASTKENLMELFAKTNAPILVSASTNDNKKRIALWIKIGVAAALIGVISTFLFNYNGDLTSNSEVMAVNDKPSTEEKTTITTIEDKTVESTDIEKKLIEANSLVDESDKVQPEVSKEVDLYSKQEVANNKAGQDQFNFGTNTELQKAEVSKFNESIDDYDKEVLAEVTDSPMDDYKAETEKYFNDSDMMISDDLAISEDESSAIPSPSIAATVATDGSSMTTNERAQNNKETQTLANESFASKKNDEDNMNSPILLQSKSLSENADLIKHFHTAM